MFKILFAFILFASVCSLILFLPVVQNLLVDTAQKFLGRTIVREYWRKVIVAFEISYLLLFLLPFCLFFFLYKKIEFSAEKEIPLFPETQFKNFQHKKIFYGFVIAVFAICSAFRFYWMNQKKSFHEDELYSIGICNHNPNGFGYWGGIFRDGEKFSGKEIRENSYFDNPAISDSAKDVLKLWINNRDSPHTSLYYMIFRIWFTGAKTSDFKMIFIRGSLLNFIFFAAAFFFMLKLLQLICKNSASIPVLLLLSFCNPASIGISVFLRPYALHEATMIMFSFLFARYFLLLQNGTKSFTKKIFFQSAVIVTLAISSAYFELFYVFILGALLLILFAAKKDKKNPVYFLAMICLSILFARILYLSYGEGLFVGRGTEAMGKTMHVFGNSLRSVKNVRKFVSGNFMPIFLILAVLILSCIFIFTERKKNLKIQFVPVLISASVLLWTFVVCFFEPIVTLRYIAPSFALLPLAFVPCVESKKIFSAEIFVHAVLLLFVLPKTFPAKINAKNIEHLDDNSVRIPEMTFTENPSIPVFLQNDLLRPYIFPYLSDEQIYFFVDDVESAENFGLAEYYKVSYTRNPTYDYSQKLIRDGKEIPQEEIISAKEIYD